ncbi:MAG: prenyltransferase [Erysipelotrichaceae bacterium]|nr:prenyltransferase [Erysipelotrichaceae bacterium]MDD3810384.1 prenyltransferase [Erysipelotrichaceae bacterium]
MTVDDQYEADVARILSHRFDLGDDFWTTADRRLIKGAPFSTLESVLYLMELGMDPGASPLKECSDLIFETWQEDGRFKLAPKGASYPCQTIHGANVLCQMGYADDQRIQKTLRHLLDIQHDDGGWRCNKFSFGRGKETEASNPFPTLVALNVFRFGGYANKEPALDLAVDFLLDHWTTRAPLGPCHYGIGSLFMQVEYPFRNYNLFIYVYVLSFYDRARKDSRFLEALAALQAKMIDGKIVVERVVPKLAKFSFCKKGQPSMLATGRYNEIMANLEKQ